MILLTKLDKARVLVSLENIKYIEATPDSLVRFVNGDMLIVCESLAQIAELVEGYNIKCLAAANQSAREASNILGGSLSWT